MYDRPFGANHPNHDDEFRRKYVHHTRESTISTSIRPSKHPHNGTANKDCTFCGQNSLENRFDLPIIPNQPCHHQNEPSPNGSQLKQSRIRPNHTSPVPLKYVAIRGLMERNIHRSYGTAQTKYLPGCPASMTNITQPGGTLHMNAHILDRRKISLGLPTSI